MLTLIWGARARADYREALEYIADRNDAAAEGLREAVEAGAERLQQHPFMYRPGRAPGTREAVIHPNYILIYRVTANTVEIVRLVHARQHYP